ncbi:hypothetical protein LWI29_022806 [Acer saccharum]|uniref:Uncharacterized protein n=1 Tax=Acer saccharum TaxID=4024 RepID=A0AA39W251_ACESA|nr:hypothetical protein LWI29_022806 [Acer saccharum]
MLSASLVGSLIPGYGAYTASKAAVETLVKILAKELKGTGITANCVAPGPIATEIFFDGKTEEMVKKAIEQCPHGRLGETKDVAPVVGFLATDASEWINGQVIRVNGGYVYRWAATSVNPGVESLPLKDRVAIVTGSSRGIGRAIAIHLSQLGAKPVINYTSNSAQADIVAAEINSSASPDTTLRAVTVQADVSDPAQVKSLFDSAERAFDSPIHVLVNSAGVLDPKYPSIPNTSLEEFDRIFR